MDLSFLPQTEKALLFPKRPPFTDNSFVSVHIVENTAPTIVLFPQTELQLATLDELISGFTAVQLNTVILAEEAESLPNYALCAAERFDAIVEKLRDDGMTGPLFVMGSALGNIAAISTMLAKKDILKGILLENIIGDLPVWLKEVGKGDVSNIDNSIYLKEIEKAMASIKKPTMIFHGAKDIITPVGIAEKLQAASSATNKQFYVIPGAPYPSDLPLAHFAGTLYFTTIRQFTDSVCGINTWRQRRKKTKLKP